MGYVNYSSYADYIMPYGGGGTPQDPIPAEAGSNYSHEK